MKAFLISLAFILILILIPFLSFVAIISIPFICIYYIFELFAPQKEKKKKDIPSFFDYAVKHINTKKNESTHL